MTLVEEENVRRTIEPFRFIPHATQVLLNCWRVRFNDQGWTVPLQEICHASQDRRLVSFHINFYEGNSLGNMQRVQAEGHNAKCLCLPFSITDEMSLIEVLESRIERWHRHPGEG